MSNDTRRNIYDRRSFSLPHELRDAVRQVPDTVLDELDDKFDAASARYYSRKHDEATSEFYGALWSIVNLERMRRSIAREDARVVTESNGHEVEVVRIRESEETTWQAKCTCGLKSSHRSRESRAELDAQRHADLSDGKVLDSTEGTSA